MQEEDIMNRLSLGLSEFDNIIKENKIYVDKTKFIKKMLDQGRKYYFLSRPRRFGKTLLVSTLENFFQGKKDLFKDTYLYYNWDDWSEYPIIRISMSDILNTTPRKLENGILNKLDFIASIHDIELDKTEDYVSEFSKLIYKIYKNNEEKEVIVLIDEYDAPILDHINNTGLANDNRKILQNFYNVLKNNEEHLKFVFITGITKFTKTSIFSKFNNFVELSLHEDYTTICG
ncbi:MAG: AAA family ATPase, partial [Methanobrevibacter sp.]|nr:AAA family ATPase [Candidatus Methanovirga procula]